MQTKRSGFTLIELLTVIGILALLIAVLVPAVNSVRVQARKTTTRSTISALETGLEQFRADQRIGGKYIPSASDLRNGDSTTPLTYRTANPYDKLDGHFGGDRIIQTGAGLLVWGLAGADLIGPTGFKVVRTAAGSAYWGADTNTDNPRRGPGQAGIYSLDPSNNRQPVYQRVDPLVDLSRIKITPWDVETSSYVVPTEIKIRKAMGQNVNDMPQRHYPMFLDAFDQPILYWRADKAGLEMVDSSPNEVTPRERGIYHFADNAHLLTERSGVGAIGGGKPVWLTRNRNPFGNDEPHDAQFNQGDFQGITGSVNAARDLSTSDNPNLGFARMIQDRDVQARPTPQNKDTYILLSPGPDGIFGTADDIGNIKNNAQ